MRTKSNIFLVFTSLLFAIFISCSGEEVYSRFHHVEDGKWYRDSVLVFTIDSLSRSFDTRVSDGKYKMPHAEYKVMVELTTNRGYPYRDLWLIIEQNLTDSLIHTDTLRLILANEHGKWLGSGVGGLNRLSLPYRSFIPRDSVYNYRIGIRHGMDEELLRGVETVGIKIVEGDGKNGSYHRE